MTNNHRSAPAAPLRKVTYSVDEVSELLGISRTSDYECIRRGEIPARRFGRRVVVLRHELEHLLSIEPGNDR